METDLEREGSLPEESDNGESNVESAAEKTSEDFHPAKCECERPETPSSDASTSGVCSLASSDLDSFDENLEEKTTKNGQENEEEQEEEEEDEDEEEEEEEDEEVVTCPVIIYQNRNILDLIDNMYPYTVYQSTSVPKMNMTNYWERRSVYHRLGPYGHLDEFDFQNCLLCDFHTPVPKRL